jgi:hypothetical protein
MELTVETRELLNLIPSNIADKILFNNNGSGQV